MLRKFKRVFSKFNPHLLSLPKTQLVSKYKLSGVALNHLINEEKFNTVLDIGSGSGAHADEFENAGKDVTRFDFGKSRAFTDDGKVLIGDFVEYDFDSKFDLVWASHVLEHTVHTHTFLTKIRAVTKPGGLVAITVPPAKPEFVGGHVTLWTPALLLYRLVLAGFDCSKAQVFVYGYNISVVLNVCENNLDISELAWDFNDIDRLKMWFPEDLVSKTNGSKYGKIFKGVDNFFAT
ncbi:class I SAM-dependent methyltransferase [Pseudopelagicola sp. nBUS_19]|uniref:class I SAM-dependent methyltransferase n=1 Tax=Pseudopelagicola sp. nBUS_19 TaxID=3395316 RepID=UPI003EBD07BC